MLYTSNNKNVKRESNLKSSFIIISIIVIVFMAIAKWGDLS
jgi:hypothetical protein